MSKRLIIALLIISVAFNLAFLGSFIFMRYNHLRPPFHPHTKAMPPEREQRPPEDRPRVEESAAIKAKRDEFRKIKTELYTELAKDPINEARVKQILESSLVAQSSLERDLGDVLLQLRKSMSAAEAKTHFENRIKRLEQRHERREKRTRRNK